MTYNTYPHLDVLWLDDEKFITSVSQHILEEEFDHHVCMVNNVPDFIDYLFDKDPFAENLINDTYDVIIMDIMMLVDNFDNKHIKFSNRDYRLMDDGMNTGIVLAKKLWSYSPVDENKTNENKMLELDSSSLFSKKYNKINNIPILFYSARNTTIVERSLRETYPEIKCDDFIYDIARKPLFACEIHDRLIQLFERWKSRC